MKSDEIGPTTSLNEYLRNFLHLTATKNMCFEGGCGACVVAVETKTNERKVFTVNSVSITTCALFFLQSFIRSAWYRFCHATVGRFTPMRALATL